MFIVVIVVKPKFRRIAEAVLYYYHMPSGKMSMLFVGFVIRIDQALDRLVDVTGVIFCVTDILSAK